MTGLWAGFVADLLSNDIGATGIEYGFLASLIAIALMAGFGAVGNEVDTTYSFVEGEIADATP